MTRYKTINGFTKQKMIEVIKSKNTGMRSTAPNGRICMYRSKDENGNTNCCVVGAFIPDDVYKPEMECELTPDYNIPTDAKYQGTVTELLTRFPEVEPYMPLDSNALMWLQLTHDRHDVKRRGDLHTALINWIEENVED